MHTNLHKNHHHKEPYLSETPLFGISNTYPYLQNNRYIHPHTHFSSLLVASHSLTPESQLIG